MTSAVADRRIYRLSIGQFGDLAAAGLADNRCP